MDNGKWKIENGKLKIGVARCSVAVKLLEQREQTSLLDLVHHSPFYLMATFLPVLI
jgi:hypothetical protein